MEFFGITDCKMKLPDVNIGVSNILNYGHFQRRRKKDTWIAPVLRIVYLIVGDKQTCSRLV